MRSRLWLGVVRLARDRLGVAGRVVGGGGFDIGLGVGCRSIVVGLLRAGLIDGLLNSGRLIGGLLMEGGPAVGLRDVRRYIAGLIVWLLDSGGLLAVRLIVGSLIVETLVVGRRGNLVAPARAGGSVTGWDSVDRAGSFRVRRVDLGVLYDRGIPLAAIGRIGSGSVRTGTNGRRPPSRHCLSTPPSTRSLVISFRL